MFFFQFYYYLIVYAYAWCVVEICVCQYHSVPIVVRGQLFFHLYVGSWDHTQVARWAISKASKIFSGKCKEESQNERTVPNMVPPKALVSC